MYRSPVPTGVGVATPNPDSGRVFGPHFIITCDEGIIGNNEISPVATERAENGSLTLATAVHHIFVPHDNAAYGLDRSKTAQTTARRLLEHDLDGV